MYKSHTRQGQMQKEVVVIKSVSFPILPSAGLGNLRHTKSLLLSIKSHFRGMLSEIFHACRCNKEENSLFNNGYVEDPRQRHSGMTPYFITAWGFTLIELLVAIMIIGILAAVAVPQYQKAVMKSRFAAMMPIAKTLANANEVYYAEHDEYSTDPAKLNVTPQAGTPDGTAINMYSNPEEVSFVRVENPGVPNARYVVYQKLSENFPDTAWCEAGDERAEGMCEALGGTLPDGVTGNSTGQNNDWKAYLLAGRVRDGDSFAEGSGEEPGTNTEPEPQTPTVTKISAEDAQALADEKCLNKSYGCVGIANDDGTVSVCENRNGVVNEATSECSATGTGTYEKVYNADGTPKYLYYCSGMDADHCYGGMFYNYNAGVVSSTKTRTCADNAAISKDFTSCSNGQFAQTGNDSTNDSYGNTISSFDCSSVNANGQCTAYSKMRTRNTIYDGDTKTGFVDYLCGSISGTTCSNNNYKPSAASHDIYNSEGKLVGWNYVQCYDSSGNISNYTSINSDGSCPSGYSWKQLTIPSSGSRTFKTCTNYANINWETATCS